VIATILAGWLALPPRLLEVRSERLEGRPAVVVVAGGALADVAVRRDGSEVVMSLVAVAPEALAAPAVAPPLEALRIERAGGRVELRVRVPPEVPYEVRREVDRLVLVFGTAAPSRASGPSAADLYQGLFPLAAEDPSGGQVAGGQVGAPGGTLLPERPPEEKPAGFTVGALTVAPSVSLGYVDADVSLLDTPGAVRDQYAEARPALGLELPVRDGRLRLDYEARIRRYSSFAQVNGITHEANGRLEYPVGPFATLRGQGHFARGLLETAEVDPGGEYFFRLGRFTRRQFGAGVRFNPGGRFDVDVAGGLNRVDVDAEAGFFDYERRSASGAFGMEVGPGRRASLAYAFEQVPPSSERPQAESSIHSLSAAVDGEILPLLSGRASVGYTRRESPRPEGGQRFRGLSFGAELRRDFGRASNVVVSANRSTELSNFEDNAFYVYTSVWAILTAPLPFSFALTAGGGYHVNRYPTAASRLGIPRRDEIVGWQAGIARSLTRWAYVRADYREDRRDSNLDVFDLRTHAFYARLGLGFFGDAPRR
jgi:hypothetical protein